MQAPLSRTALGEPLPFEAPLLPPVPFRLDPLPLSGTLTAVPAWRTEGARKLSSSMAPFFPKGPSIPDAPATVAEGLGLAHDAGNLLGALRLYSDLLARPGVLRDEHRHYAEELRLIGGRSGALIDRLLNPAATAGRGSTARRGSSTLLAPQESSDLPFAVIPEVIARCRGLLDTVARRAIEVVIEHGAAAPVAARSEAIERILVNLTKNAAEASSASHTIVLRVHADRSQPGARTPARVVLSVEDQGGGMSAAAARVLLGEEEPTPLAPGQTRGLGLRVVRELASRAGAEVRLHTSSECGTRIEIGWQVAALAPTTSASESTHHTAARTVESNTGRMTC